MLVMPCVIVGLLALSAITQLRRVLKEDNLAVTARAFLDYGEATQGPWFYRTAWISGAVLKGACAAWLVVYSGLFL